MRSTLELIVLGDKRDPQQIVEEKGWSLITDPTILVCFVFRVRSVSLVALILASVCWFLISSLSLVTDGAA
jgi:hypothetical protein